MSLDSSWSFTMDVRKNFNNYLMEQERVIYTYKIMVYNLLNLDLSRQIYPSYISFSYTNESIERKKSQTPTVKFFLSAIPRNSFQKAEILQGVLAGVIYQEKIINNVFYYSYIY